MRVRGTLLEEALELDRRLQSAGLDPHTMAQCCHEVMREYRQAHPQADKEEVLDVGREWLVRQLAEAEGRE